MANAELLKKLKAASTIELSSVLEDSTVFNKGDLIQTPVPMLNVALSGALDGGFASGLTLWAGPSKHFKSSFVLMCAAAYMKKYPDAILLFYDSEFGTPQGYFKAMGIATDRVFHVPVTTVEQLRSDIAKQLENIKKGDHVFIAIDSVGNLASAKEVKDAIEEHSAADMTRAKQIKSLFRIITPQLSLKDIPCHCVMHIYMTMEMFSKPVVSGGSGAYYSADNIYILGRQQEKEGTNLKGYNFVVNVEKSRFVKEKSKVLLNVSFEDGINTTSGLLEAAVDLGFIVKPKQGWYSIVNKETGEMGNNFRAADADKMTFWVDLLVNKRFQEAIKDKYQIGRDPLFKEEA